MTDQNVRTPKTARKIMAIILFAVTGILLAAAVFGFVQQGAQQTKDNMTAMRNESVLHAASTGLIDRIALDARAAKLAELRKDKNFRKRGQNEINSICDAAMEEARREAEQKYSNPVVTDPEAFNRAVDRMTSVVSESSTLRDEERAVYADIYLQLIENIDSWREIAPEDADEAAVTDRLTAKCPDLDKAENRHLQAGLAAMARDMAAKEQEQAEKEEKNQLLDQMSRNVENWEEYADLEDQAVWDKLTAEYQADLANYSGWESDIIDAAKQCAEAARDGKELPTWSSQTDKGATVASEALVNYSYFTESEKLQQEQTEKAEAYGELESRLTEVIPDLAGVSGKLKQNLQESIEKILSQHGKEFSLEYQTYLDNGGEKAVSGGTFQLKMASLAKYLLLGGIAVLLLGLVMFFWKQLTSRFGVPRTIITLFFIFLCLLAEGYRISVGMMLGNVLERMTMYGILVLAMMPGIQCGIGLNMGMTIGCISGLLGIMIALQYNMTGFPAMAVACLCGIAVALPLGWAYSKLLNRMKGNEMTISTYVGFSFVSLMCIGWMLLPFDNPKIIWLLSGKGLRVTHGLLGSFAHILDNALSFKVLGIKIPTGGLLFLGVCCLLMWIFTRSKTGIAMKAVGSNPRFAEASGISVNRMRTIGTVLSTVIAAVGIVIYSQAFGYAQLYTAPRQLGFIASSAILIGGASVTKAKVSHVLVGVFLFEGVLVFGQQIANSAISGGGLSEVMRILISNGIILYALTQSGGGRRE